MGAKSQRPVPRELKGNVVTNRTRKSRPGPGRPAGRPPRRRFSGLRDARIRSKLSLILVVPVIAILVLAGLRLVDSGRRAVDADLVGKLTSLSAEVSTLTHQLHRERMTAAELLGSTDRMPEVYNQQSRRTDDVVARYTAARGALGELPAGISDRLSRIDEHLTRLSETRQEVLAGQGTSISQVVLRYGVMISDLVAYREEMTQVAGDLGLADQLRAAAAFSKAKANASEEQAVAYAALKQSGRLDDEQLSSFLATLTGQQESMVAFALAASDEQRGLVERTVTGAGVQLADQAANDLVRFAGTTPPVSAAEASNAIGAVTDLMRWTEDRLDRSLVSNAVAIRAAVLRQVAIESIVVLVTLILAVAFALLLARSMARSLGRLREGALLVAQHELPNAVARLRDVQSLGETSPEEIARQVRDPIALNSRDEIGQVGQAFNVVHREAVRVAAEQAALRTSVSAMFLNLARRSQSLVDRMIGELDQIERDEEDPKRLAQLFQLDHLATRMRRNDENLLVLAGADSSPPRDDDALLIDAVRAAQSEVELYDRIEFGTIDTDVSIVARAVNDVVRLLAELMDNATRFSPPNTIVVADARRIGDYVLIQVEDRGLGMSDEQMNALNERLRAPSTVDISAFRMMGLAVVARLASRYDIRVELRRNADGGTIANVALPSSILLLPKIRGREPVITRQRAPLAVETRQTYAQRTRAAMPQAIPATSADWAPADDAARRVRPAVAVGLHVTGTAASAAAAAASTSMPVAGRSVEAVVVAQADDTTELPIYREMETSWFRAQDRHGGMHWSTTPVPASAPPASAPPAPSMPTPDTYARTDAYARPDRYGSSGGYQPPTNSASPAGGGQGPAGAQPREPRHEWQTSADQGWQAAAAAAEPQVAGTTRSGLPKRKPMGQLVPGGVEREGPASRTRRTPEEVRGLLSAYHRGVQRGRAGGESSNFVEPDSRKGIHG